MVVEGCKKTNIGLMPEDWNLLCIPDIISKKDGMKIGPFGSQLKKELLVKNGYKVYGQENVYEKDLEIGDRFITKEHFVALKSCELHPHDFIISMMGTIGKCLIVPKNIQQGIMDSHLLRLRLNDKIISADLLLHFFSSKPILDQVFQLTVGGIMNGLSSSIIRKIQIPIPPSIKEQTTIATALTDTDALIENLEKLIVKKRNIKQGAMQELLTGRRRLEGYSSSWKTIELKDIVLEFIVPMRDKPKRFEGIIPWCRIEDFNGKYLNDSKSNQYVNKEIIKDMNLKILPTETLIVSCSADLGRCAIVKNPLTTNQTFIGLVFNENIASNEFFYYYLTFNAETLNNLSSGTTISYLSREQFEIFKVHIPIYKTEQDAIAKILSDMDNEIEGLEQKLYKYRMIKQGMMQVLLTGKIRLI